MMPRHHRSHVNAFHSNEIPRGPHQRSEQPNASPLKHVSRMVVVQDRNGEGVRRRSLRYSNRRTCPDALDASDQPSQIRQLHVPLCWQT